ncbi:energy transducer TonB family protein [Sinorhizobium mexicanum]|uniref:Energy transducer TonB n=1 Tax=Sinorhizobium mexicanum TaxID=375549 RepID=A0A859QTK1_9HYPH|nr:energy transducer TonB [Sinorhizobium mexicanum]MBP1883636.1 protein TonB [Sinorhizobium mexicanum]QLL62819.1 energy transducer TonB [Sinorhizobium mexicanum]
MKQTVKWTAAIALSLLAHASGAMLFSPDEEAVQIAGGAATEVTLLGDAFEQTLQAGDPSEIVEPTEEVPEELKPEEVQPTEEVREEVPPSTPEIAVQQPSDITPAEADVILPTEEMPTLQSPEAVVTASVAPVETVVPEEKPEPERVEKPKAEKPEPKKQPVKKKVTRKKTGDGGEQAKSQVKGTADGVENAAASAATGDKGRVAQQSGNAAVSNYPGKVRSKLNRAFRYPSEAKRQRLRGVAQVRFTVTSGGGVAGVSLAKSAGSPILDQAALDAVRRAVPFPAIPDGAGRDRWVFTIPLAFNR